MGSISAPPSDLGSQRSFGLFTREEREYTDAELSALSELVQKMHIGSLPPTTLTQAEIDVLVLLKDGKLMKEIAFQFGVSDSAIKQRLRSAKQKLGASTNSQAISKAVSFGLI